MAITYSKGKTPIVAGSKVVHTISPRWELEFFPHSGSSITTVHAGGLTGRDTSDALQVTTHKELGAPFGTWSAVLVPRKDYRKLISPGDWCEIRAGSSGVAYQRVMYGPITSVRRTRNVEASGSVQERVLVQGADFGRVFAFTEAFYDTKLVDDAFIAANYASVVSRLNTPFADAGNLVQELVSFYLEKQRQWVDPRTGETFGTSGDVDRDRLNYKYISKTTRGGVEFSSINTTASLWQLMMQWANVPLNELFIDYRPPFANPSDIYTLTPAVVLREAPFTREAFDALPSIEVNANEVTSEDIGRSDADIANWIRVTDEPSLTSIAGGVAAYTDKLGVINPKSVERFGFRRYEPPTGFIFGNMQGGKLTSEQQKVSLELLETFTGLAALWHHSNEQLYEGVIETYLRPEARIGYRLIYTNSNTNETMAFYVESVSHTMSYPGRCTTRFHVTRGHDPKDPLFTAGLATLEARGVLRPIGSTFDRIRGQLGA